MCIGNTALSGLSRSGKIGQVAQNKQSESNDEKETNIHGGVQSESGLGGAERVGTAA